MVTQAYGGDDLDDASDLIVATQMWPRLYLDTSDLLDIADGTVDARVVEDLFAVIATRRIVVLFTVEHLVDIAAKGLSEGAEQLGKVAERFPWRVVVTTDPSVIEPWQQVGVDIGLQFAPNIREFFTHPAALPVVGHFSDFQDRVHLAEEAIRPNRTTRARRLDSLSKRESELYWRTIITLVRGWLSTDIEQIMAFHVKSLDRPLEDRAYARVYDRVAMCAQFLQNTSSLLEEFDHGSEEILKQMIIAHDGERAPGLHLAMQFSMARRRDPGRTSQRSDTVDSMHAIHFPYVDVATCDRFSYSILKNLVKTTVGPRSPSLIRTGHLSEVVSELQKLALPSHTGAAMGKSGL